MSPICNTTFARRHARLRNAEFLSHISLSRTRPAAAAPPMHFRIGALRSGDFVNSTLCTAVLIALALVLVARFGFGFGFGFYWLSTKDCSARPNMPTRPTSPASIPIEEFDEREAHAPCPDHVFLDTREADAESTGTGPSTATRHEAAQRDDKSVRKPLDDAPAR